MSYRNETQSNQHDVMECPFCNSNFSFEPSDVPWRDGDTIDHTCECGNELEIMAETVVSWVIGSDEDDVRKEQNHDR